MTVQEIYNQLARLIDDGHGEAEVTATIDGSLEVRRIEWVEIYDDPFIVISAEVI